jgi:hypothetical protein|tara:strand:- start:2014 stop:2889 length:876 start_codon:yes stop_codon:yes gene_type:complete
MTLALIVLGVALAISGVAAFYSIVGLMAIFSASALSIAVMGSVLEVGKLATASWLYQNWKKVPRFLKYYLTGAVVILMFITSMGIFGYLSKSHIDAGTGTSELYVKLERLDSNIESERKSISRAEGQLEKLDFALERYIELNAVSKGLRKRDEQKPERDALAQTVDDSQDKIDIYLDERAEIQLKIKSFEVEVGPLKYISALLFGENESVNYLDKAVRYVIILLIFVFDPLAVLMLIAANMSLKEEKNKRKRRERKNQPKNAMTTKVSEDQNTGMRKVVKEKNGVQIEYYE